VTELTPHPPASRVPPSPRVRGEGWGEGLSRPEQLVLELDGYEGPIDLLLTLAREQKVDLGKISILALADQYLAFLAKQHALNLEIAADYLVMAAWLAYLKSRLLLPQPPQDDEPSGTELAAELEHRLRLLEAMQTAGVRLMGRPRIGQDVLLRGAPEGLTVIPVPVYELALYELLRAYGEGRRRTEAAVLSIEPAEFYSICFFRTM
jgi:segregation and condensation protein A